MLPSRLYSLLPQVFWWAFQSDWTAYNLEHFVAFPFLLAVFAAEVLFEDAEVSESSSWVMVDA